MNSWSNLKDPISQFSQWLTEAKQLGLKEPGAMTLSTCDPQGQPHARIVLCKEVRARSLVFYTNYKSAKGQQMAANSKVAASFFWDALARQILITGSVKKTSRAESEAYWNSRAKESQISQYISQQSESLKDLHTLETKALAAEKEFASKSIPCPEHWGGYELSISSIEFWIGQPHRRHHRHFYQFHEHSWSYQLLYP